MSLTQGARTIASEIFLRVLSDMTILPRDAKNPLGLGVVYFCGEKHFEKINWAT